MDSDEMLARKLQEQFDNEVQEMEKVKKNDLLLAQKIASESHCISSESESEEEEAEKKTESQGENSHNSIGLKTSNKRPICKFGADCYRKNTLHLEEFFHPNDSKNSSNANTPKRIKKESTNLDAVRKTFLERLNLSEPFNFFLNKIFSAPHTHKDPHTLVFPDLLSSTLGNLIESAQINFMVDLDYIMKFYQACKVDKTPVLFLYGLMEGNPSKYEKVNCVKVNIPYQYGVHHTKMMLFQYNEGLRVVIHTANLKPDDWEEKTQGFWVSPLFPPLDRGKASVLDGESATFFKRDLMEYLLSYKKAAVERWANIIRAHDFSSCRVYFIGSVPGYYTGENRSKFGHLKCRSIVRKAASNNVRKNKLSFIIQCSSIGSLGKDARAWVRDELTASFSPASEALSTKVCVIYPSEDDVRNSSQGYGGGSCLPYNSKTHQKQPWLKQHFHHWRSVHRGRNRAMPHVKTYCGLIESDGENPPKARFFLLTSSNLSKAAWGVAQKQQTQVFVRSYEAGVLWMPKQTTGEETFSLNGSDGPSLRLPYDFPLTPYSANATPWFMDTPKNNPDCMAQKYP